MEGGRVKSSRGLDELVDELGVGAEERRSVDRGAGVDGVGDDPSARDLVGGLTG